MKIVRFPKFWVCGRWAKLLARNRYRKTAVHDRKVAFVIIAAVYQYRAIAINMQVVYVKIIQNCWIFQVVTHEVTNGEGRNCCVNIFFLWSRYLDYY